MNSGQASFSYDGDGNRVAKTVNGVTTHYLVDTNNPTGYAQVVDEITGNQVARTYTDGHSLVSQRQLINNQWQVSFYGYDGQGSVRLLTDVTGAITDTYTYDAFGNLIASTGNTPNEHLYTGERFDANLGFYYLRARYLNPVSSRFQTMDSVAGMNFEPRTLHKYTYAENDPVNRRDPSGHRSIAELVTVQVTWSILAAMAVLTLATACYLQYALAETAELQGVDTSKVAGPCVRRRFDPDKQFYRGTTYYDALEIVQNQRIDRFGLNTGYDLGPGVYLSKDLASARYYAWINGGDGRAGGGAVVSVKIATSKWSALRQAGALEDMPTSNLPFLQSFVPAPLVPYFNSYARFGLIQ